MNNWLLYRVFNRTLIIICLAIFAGIHSVAQHYIPRKVYSSNTNLIKSLEGQKREELTRLGTSWSRDQNIIKAYNLRTKNLVDQIKRGFIIEDDTIQRYVDFVFNRLISANKIFHTPGRVLISKAPMCNAYCVGEGTFVVTVGLLGRMHNESELAFTLAHEIAHYELDHIRTRTFASIEQKHDVVTKRSVEKIWTGDDDDAISEMDSLRKMVYGIYQHSRYFEMQADSLGLVYMRNAEYDESQSISLLSILDSADYTKDHLGPRVFDPLRFSKYPFQEYWLKPRPSLYEKQRDRVFIFATDSVESHPDIEIRIDALRKSMEKGSGKVNQQAENFINQVTFLCSFESVEAALRLRWFDYALLQALQQKIEYPESPYATSAIAKIFIELYQMKDQNATYDIVLKPSPFYGEELRQVNSFLSNLLLEELGEIAFHFMNNQTNFNPAYEEHYYLLWQVCDLTRRDNVKRKVVDNYKSRFGKGKYASKMN